jgi:CDP-glucose 4,6-dehydratase
VAIGVCPMEGLVSMFWKGKKVFVTGHTGFKGGWLSLWLQSMGAQVVGYALEPPATPNLFEVAQIAAGMESVIGDIRDLTAVQKELARHRPEIVMHLAAQPLVRLSYEDPIGTYQTNVIGSANLLEAIRGCNSVRACVMITTDKCYENREWVWAYRENDPLGGYDPYSNSKACAELLVSAYRNSFFHPARFAEHNVAIASARAGNVIGGGDWAPDRLMADIFRAFSAGEVLKVRNPKATRPWQHVLEPVRGYLMLAESLYKHGTRFGEAWNFGPKYDDAKPVEWIVERMAAEWGASVRWAMDVDKQPHEANMLKLDWTKASQELGWCPLLTLSEALDMTLDWYKVFLTGGNVREKCLEQIRGYARKSTYDSPSSTKGAAN